LPNYDLSEPGKVKVYIIAKRKDEKYAKLFITMKTDTSFNKKLSGFLHRTATQYSFVAALLRSDLIQCLLQVGYQVFHVLKPKRDADKVVHHADCMPVFLGIVEE